MRSFYSTPQSPNHLAALFFAAMAKTFLTTVPKLVSFVGGIYFLPTKHSDMPTFLALGLLITLLLHHVSPNKTAVTHDPSDVVVITVNILMTAVVALAFVHYAEAGITSVDSLMDIPLYQYLFIPLWILVDEILFFFIHRFAHRPGIYEHCHKLHHKHKITSSWTSFVAHPLDHLVAVLGAALISPFLMLRLNVQATAPIVAMFLYGAIVTFINSHHTTVGTDGKPEGGDHLLHHTRFTVNYSNFGFFDVWNKSYLSSAKVAE